MQSEPPYNAPLAPIGWLPPREVDIDTSSHSPNGSRRTKKVTATGLYTTSSFAPINSPVYQCQNTLARFHVTHLAEQYDKTQVQLNQTQHGNLLILTTEKT